MNYTTMEIRITRGQSLEAGNTYLVSASEIMHRGPVNPAQAMFTLPSDIEQRLNLLLVENRLRNTKSLEEQAARAKSFGIELFNALFQSEVKKLYHELKAKAMRPQSVMRLRLQIVPAELSTLPWELLHDGEQYLCLNGHPKILFARVPTTIVKKRALSYNPPLRLLGMTACPYGQDKLDVEREQGYINTALEDLIQEKRVEIEWKKAEPSVVRDLKFDDPCHVLHFIGHGYFDEKENKENREGKLIFEDAKGNRFDFDAHRLSLALHKNIQLVFLNACDTARGDPLDYLSNFAYKLAISGIPAIVAMQFKITDDDAIQFARVFYERIAHGDAVDEAVTEARHHIYVGANVSSLQWIAPILYISTSNSISFKVANTAPATKRRSKDPVLPTPTSGYNQQGQPQNVKLTQQSKQEGQEQSLPPPMPAETDIGRKSGQKARTRWTKIVAVVLTCLVLGSIFLYFVKPNPNPPSPTPSTPTTLCLATDLPMSGPAGETGRDIRNGVELALMQSPLSTMYHGYDLKRSYMDDSSRQNGDGPDPATGVKNIQNLFQQTACPNPIAIIGPYDSPVAVAEIPLAAQNHILLLSPSTTAPCLTQKKYSDPETCNYDSIHPQGLSNTYAHLAGDDTVRGYLTADFLLAPPNSKNPGQGGLGAKRIAIIGDEEIAGTQLSKIVIEALKNKRVTPIEVDCIKPPEEYSKNPSCSLNPATNAFSLDNIAALAAKIRDQQPDAIFFGGRPDRGAGLLRKQLGELGLDQIPFLGAGPFVASKNEFLQTMGSHAVNVYAIVSGAAPSTFTSGTAATFSKEYENVFGKSPGASSANGYDAATIILQVIKDQIDAGKTVTRESVAQTVLSGKFIGVAGNHIRFDNNGDNIGQRVYTIYQGQQQSQGTWDFNVLTQRAV